MYLASVGRATHPWYISQLNKELFTLEGLCWYVARYPRYFVHAFEDGQVDRWLRDELRMDDLAEIMEQKRLQGSSALTLAPLLMSATPYSRTIDLDALKATYQTYMSMPAHLQYKEKGDEAFRNSEWKQAIQYYKSAQAITYTVEVDNNLAITYLAIDDSIQAKMAFDRCIERSDSLTGRLNRVRFNFRKEAYEDMLYDLSHLSGLYDDGEVWYYYGVAYEALKRYEEAIAAFAKALEVSVLDKYLKAFVQLCMTQGCIPVLESWLVSHPLDAERRLYVQGQLALEAGDHDTYLTCMETVIDHRPKQVMYLFEMIEFYVDKGQIIKALEYLKRIPPEHQGEETSMFYGIMVAKAAGNRDDFHRQVDALTYKWKGEARKAAGR